MFESMLASGKKAFAVPRRKERSPAQRALKRYKNGWTADGHHQAGRQGTQKSTEENSGYLAWKLSSQASTQALESEVLLDFTLLDVNVHPSLEGGQGSQKDKAAYQQSRNQPREISRHLGPEFESLHRQTPPPKSETGSNKPNHSRNKTKMAKSQRSSVTKANNQRLKKNVFGPVEAARQQRLSARLLEIASQPKPVPEKEMKDTTEQGMEYLYAPRNMSGDRTPG